MSIAKELFTMLLGAALFNAPLFYILFFAEI